MELRDTVAVVTGAAGIGLAPGERFPARGRA
jgi:hypothetical protein